MSDSSKASTNSESQVETWKPERTVKAISQILSEIAKENTCEQDSQRKYSFDSRKVPSISIQSYLDRIVKYTHIEESTLIIALIFLDRVCEINDILITELNVHRFFFSSVVTAIKYNEDDYYSNNYYAKVAGINLQELNNLEFEFVKLSRFNLYVTSEIYQKYHVYLLHYNSKN